MDCALTLFDHRAFYLLMADEMGKNPTGTGMDTKVIGRAMELPPGEAPGISMIYVRDLTRASDGNAVEVGFANVIQNRLYRKIDFDKVYLNTCTSLDPAGGRLPIHLPSDCEALDLAFGHLGSPEPEVQRVVWIRNTLSLDRIAISAPLAGEAIALKSWRLSDGSHPVGFDPAGHLNLPL